MTGPHDAGMRIGGRLRGGGPILPGGIEAMGPSGYHHLELSAAPFLEWPGRIDLVLPFPELRCLAFFVSALSRAVCRSRRPQHYALGHDAFVHEAPQRDQQLARQRHDHRLAQPP